MEFAFSCNPQTSQTRVQNTNETNAIFHIEAEEDYVEASISIRLLANCLG